jgi:hypothetical protein
MSVLHHPCDIEPGHAVVFRGPVSHGIRLDELALVIDIDDDGDVEIMLANGQIKKTVAYYLRKVENDCR